MVEVARLGCAEGSARVVARGERCVALASVLGEGSGSTVVRFVVRETIARCVG
jgi:hypothetical protein